MRNAVNKASVGHCRKLPEGLMPNLCQPYRGYLIEVRVSISPVISLSCMPRRHYNVSWSVRPVDDVATAATSVDVRTDFISYNGAHNYGERQAREFVDRELASVPV
ncbi:hypothetical protein [Paraburkholderia caribensis]|uniref:hypothetical protein n=1 Tax=Paraburkholderia caribensis TaxID=75105 RepID=UPI0011DF8772|nr:hypothetical protein [Paraburkholderia caribensis]